MGSTFSGTTTTGGARVGMVDILNELRTLTESSTSDYSLGAVTYWSDVQLQSILDRNAWQMDAEPMSVVPAYISGGYEYKNFYVGRGWLEQSTGGTAIFYVMDVDGNVVDSGDYSVDYNIGQVAFTVDQESGALYLVTCVSYDMNASAAEVWRRKAAHFHSAVDFSTDNHSIKREQMYKHCIEQAQRFESISEGANESADLVRSDDVVNSYSFEE